MVRIPFPATNYEQPPPPDEAALLIARARALQSYANLEQAMCFLLSHVGDMRKSVAATIFFKITASRSRSAILEKLYKDTWGTRFNLFFNSLIKAIGSLDQKRNELVHWHTWLDVFANEEGELAGWSLGLIPPNMWSINADTPHMSVSDIMEFGKKCEALAAITDVFTLTLTEAVQDDAWNDIFQRELAYPLPADHPLFRTRQAEGNPPQSSGA